MTCSVTDEITKHLPPEVITVNPLEFEWEEATNAIIFTSNFDKVNFEEWEEALVNYYKNMIVNEHQLDVESDDDISCISFWFSLDKILKKMIISILV